MAIFSRGVTPAARRDLARIYGNSAPHDQAAIHLAYQQLMADIRATLTSKARPPPCLAFRSFAD